MDDEVDRRKAFGASPSALTREDFAEVHNDLWNARAFLDEALEE